MGMCPQLSHKHTGSVEESAPITLDRVEEPAISSSPLTELLPAFTVLVVTEMLRLVMFLVRHVPSAPGHIWGSSGCHLIERHKDKPNL